MLPKLKLYHEAQALKRTSCDKLVFYTMTARRNIEQSDTDGIVALHK